MRGQARFDPAGLHARASGRSWWALRYHDGRLLHERDRDWSHCPATGRQRLRLYCPNGEIAELGGDREQRGRLFQLKVAVRHGAPSGALPSRTVLAHVIGRIHSPDGRCTLYAWEPAGPVSPEMAAWLRSLAAAQGGFTRLAEQSGLPSAAIAGVIRNGGSLSAAQIARLIERSSSATGVTCAAIRRWCGLAQLVGPLEDNIHHMAYHQLGALCPEHLGIASA